MDKKTLAYLAREIGAEAAADMLVVMGKARDHGHADRMIRAALAAN